MEEETYTPTAVEGSALGDYRQVLHWTLKDKPSRIILMQVLMIPLVIVFWIIFSYLAFRVGGFELGDLQGNFTFRIGIQDVAKIGVWLVALGGTIVLHELVHGLTMKKFGAQPRYGVIWKYLVFYATSPGYAFRRNSYILVALAPLVALSLLSILGMYLARGTDWVALLALCGIVNASGAAGDLWMVSKVLRYPRTAYVVDERDGFRVLLSAGQP